MFHNRSIAGLQTGEQTIITSCQELTDMLYRLGASKPRVDDVARMLALVVLQNNLRAEELFFHARKTPCVDHLVRVIAYSSLEPEAVGYDVGQAQMQEIFDLYLYPTGALNEAIPRNIKNPPTRGNRHAIPLSTFKSGPLEVVLSLDDDPLAHWETFEVSIWERPYQDVLRGHLGTRGGYNTLVDAQKAFCSEVKKVLDQQASKA